MPAARLAPAAVALALLAPAGRAQDDALRLQGLTPAGPRAHLTDPGGALRFAVANGAAAPRDARVAVEYDARPGARFARDVWVPPRAVLSAWLPVGPAPPAGDSVEVRALLFDRTGGADALVLRTGEGEKIRSRPVPFRALTPTTALFADEAHADAAAFVKLVRKTAALTEELATPTDGPLPPTPEAFEGVDHVVVAGNRLAADPAGRWALRQWVARGGRLWVMLDLTDPDAAAPLFGDDRPVEVVDRVGLTRVRLGQPGPPPPGRDFDAPVDHVRVLPAEGDRVFAVANGWPAGFARNVGRGRVIVTTLGAAGWLPPPGPPPVPAKGVPRPGPPPGADAVQELATELHPRGRPAPLPADALRPLLDDEVGYAVMSRGTAAAVLGGFLLAVAGIGVGLRRSRRPELVGWLAPAAAVGAAGVFVGHAELSRRAIPPTLAAVAVAEPVAGTDEVVLNGVFAVYQPASGSVPLAAPRGGMLDLDAAGLEGQTRTRVYRDTDAWHVEGLDLPAGVRTGRFRATTRPGAVTAVARFGPGGLEGRLTAPGLAAPADALVVSAQRQPLAARFAPDGAFAVGADDELPPGQLLPGAVLTDRQQRRQAVYRQLLGGAPPPHLDGRDLLLTWAEAAEVPFAGTDGSRTVGTILLTAPLTFERTPPGTRATVPAAFVPVRRPDLGRPTLDSAAPTEQVLRFQLPPSVLPLEVERAVFRLRARAPGRRVAVTAEGVSLFAADSPAEPIRVEITDPRQLRPDADGGLRFTLSITDAGPAPVPWKIEELGLDVVGRTAGGP